MNFLKKQINVPVLGYFLKNKTIGALVAKSVILLIIPYLYLLLCGLIFDYWLKMYNMVLFIFFSFLALYLIAFVIIGFAIVCYVKHGKTLSKKAATSGAPQSPTENS